nr:PAS domain-containing protein tyrosine kinase family protein [Tanacetum cinerariifolium]
AFSSGYVALAFGAQGVVGMAIGVYGLLVCWFFACLLVLVLRVACDVIVLCCAMLPLVVWFRATRKKEEVSCLGVLLFMCVSMATVKFHCPFTGLNGCQDSGGNGLTRAYLITHLRDRHCNGEA